MNNSSTKDPAYKVTRTRSRLRSDGDPHPAATRLPGITQLLDLSYRLFAENRLKLTGRCNDESCPAHVQPRG